MVEEEGKFVPEEEEKGEEYKISDLVEACKPFFIDKETGEEIEISVKVSFGDFEAMMRGSYPQDDIDSYDEASGFIRTFFLRADIDIDEIEETLAEGGVLESPEKENED